MTNTKVVSKLEIENRLHSEKKLIHEGTIKEDNPLDLSEPFRELCEACRRGDLRTCQERIAEGVNINACDAYDYTPLILVSPFSPIPSWVFFFFFFCFSSLSQRYQREK